MSIEQFVRYKQQLRKVTEDFLGLANVLDSDNLEIAAARVADRVAEKSGDHAELTYKLYLLAALLDLRKSGELKRGNSKAKLRAIIQAENQRIQDRNLRKANEWRRQCADWLASEGFWRAHFWFSKKPQPKAPKYESSIYESSIRVKERFSNPDFLVTKVADFPVVTETDPPTNKTPEEYSPTKQEIKGFLEA